MFFDRFLQKTSGDPVVCFLLWAVPQGCLCFTEYFMKYSDSALFCSGKLADSFVVYVLK
jgi:hypothetical protein